MENQIVNTDSLVNKFICNLSNKFPVDGLREISMQLSLFLNDYDVYKKNTEIMVVEDEIPRELKLYLVAKSVEGLSEKTLEQYYIHLRDMFESVQKNVENITANDLRVHLHHLKTNRNLSKTTLNNRRSSLRAFFEWCKNENMIAENPCKNIKSLKVRHKVVVPLSHEEIKVMYDSCSNLRDKALFLFMLSSGCRVTEIERLNVDDVDCQRNVVRLFGKGDKERTSYISKKASGLLKEYLCSRTDGNKALFVSLRYPYQRIHKDGIESVIRKIGIKSGIERRVYPHLIRHTTATLLRQGMFVEEIQKLLGHEDINTTMIYVDICENDMKMKYDKVMDMVLN